MYFTTKLHEYLRSDNCFYNLVSLLCAYMTFYFRKWNQILFTKETLLIGFLLSQILLRFLLFEYQTFVAYVNSQICFWEKSEPRRIRPLFLSRIEKNIFQFCKSISSCYVINLYQSVIKSKYYTATGKGYEARKKVHKNLPIWDCRYMSWVHKCLKQNKNMRHFNGPVEHGQNLPPNLAEWAGSAWWIFHTCLMVSFHSKAFWALLWYHYHCKKANLSELFF